MAMPGIRSLKVPRPGSLATGHWPQASLRTGRRLPAVLRLTQLPLPQRLLQRQLCTRRSDAGEAVLEVEGYGVQGHEDHQHQADGKGLDGIQPEEDKEQTRVKVIPAQHHGING